MFDWSAAFDVIDHPILLKRLEFSFCIKKNALTSVFRSRIKHHQMYDLILAYDRDPLNIVIMPMMVRSAWSYYNRVINGMISHPQSKFLLQIIIIVINPSYSKIGRWMYPIISCLLDCEISYLIALNLLFEVLLYYILFVQHLWMAPASKGALLNIHYYYYYYY